MCNFRVHNSVKTFGQTEKPNTTRAFFKGVTCDRFVLIKFEFSPDRGETFVGFF